jgi:hypothetical protein
MDKNQRKRLIIISIYSLIFLLIVYKIYSWVKPADNCFDSVQNQNEQGIDCGGVCVQKCEIVAEHDLVVQEAGFVESGVADSYDLYAVVANPNQTIGSESFDYKFTVRNSDGGAVAIKSGTGFILPGETKYVVESNIATQGMPEKVELSISNPLWDEANDAYEKPQLKVVNKQYSEITNGIGFAEATGLLKNESSMDFTTVSIRIILKDEQGKIIALNSTEMNTVVSGENRDFRVFWPNRFSGNVSNMWVQAETNVFSSEAFVKKYFNPQKFQQYN